jgi:hypothetical protein
MAKPAAKSKRKPKAYRLMFRFWMNTSKDNELAVADYLEEMKSGRALTSTIRDAITLIQDLRAQRLDVLFTLFPWVNGWLEERAEAIATAKNKPSGGDDSGGNIINLSAKIERLESLLLSQTSGGNGLLMLAKEAQMKALPAPRVLPDEPTIQIAKAQGGGNAAENFMRSLGAMAGINFELEQPAPTPAAPKTSGKGKQGSSRKKAVQASPVSASGGIKQLSVQPIAPPSFDDFEDEISLFG